MVRIGSLKRENLRSSLRRNTEERTGDPL